MNIILELKNNVQCSSKFIGADFMFLEESIFYDENEGDNDQNYEALMKTEDERMDYLENQTSPRLIKSHLPPHLLPIEIWSVKPKLIYVQRNVRDVAVSMFHMCRNFMFLRYQENLDDYLEIFWNDHVIYGPYFDHINCFHQLIDLDHILFI